MKAEVRHLEGMTFLGRGLESSCWVPLDAPAEKGGAGSAARPMELLLIGLGGCTGMDVYGILRKMRLALAGFRVELEGDRAEEHPKGFEKITVIYHVWGDGLDEDKVAEAVRLSEEKYCGARATLSAVEFSSRIEIHPAGEAPNAPLKRGSRA